MARLILGDLPDRIRQGGQAPPKGRDTHQAGHAEAAAPAASALPEAGQVAEFVAHVNSNLFHCADCIWIRSAAPQHLIVLASPAEAQRQNYKPCRTCTPDQRQASAKARLQPERQLARQGR